MKKIASKGGRKLTWCVHRSPHIGIGHRLHRLQHVVVQEGEWLLLEDIRHIHLQRVLVVLVWRLRLLLAEARVVDVHP